MKPRFSVCIPAYNRPEKLSPLLDSILSQDFRDCEIVICEDNSPTRAEIRGVVANYVKNHPGVIRYFENEANLGYDGNLRELIARAEGDYCLFMGNDDLMNDGALAAVAVGLDRHANVGVVLRSYASFDETPDNINQIFRYFKEEAFFPAGPDTVVTFYRRSVVISGLVIRREEALKYATSEFDGTLLYQLHLVANVLMSSNGLFLPEILALYRNGGTPDFGNSAKERGRFVPTQQTPESSIRFMEGMLEIARKSEERWKVPIYRAIVRDIGNYSYPILSIQSRQPRLRFLRYCVDVARLGWWRSGMFYAYFALLFLLGPRCADGLIRFIKARLGHTPVLGNVYEGRSV